MIEKGENLHKKNQSHLWEPNVLRFSNFPLKMLRRDRLVRWDGESMSKTTWLHRQLPLCFGDNALNALFSTRSRTKSAYQRITRRNWITTGLSCHSEMSRFIASQIVSRLQPLFVSERRRRRSLNLCLVQVGLKSFFFSRLFIELRLH